MSIEAMSPEEKDDLITFNQQVLSGKETNLPAPIIRDIRNMEMKKTNQNIPLIVDLTQKLDNDNIWVALVNAGVFVVGIFLLFGFPNPIFLLGVGIIIFEIFVWRRLKKEFSEDSKILEEYKPLLEKKND